jgi:enamidase
LIDYVGFIGRFMQTAILNIGKIISGDWEHPYSDGSSILVDGGLISKVGELSSQEIDSCDVVIDAGGAVAIPGLIDSHVHITFGDFTPRQNTIGYLQSYLHGGVTTSISASEVHVPGRPKDLDGVKALAIAAKKCFENYRPGGMRVHAGSLILEPGLSQEDYQEVLSKGVWLAKAGFGAVNSASEYIPMVLEARKAGLFTTLHTGGASIPGSFPITGKDLININPHVSFHINGGPVSMEDKYFEAVARDTDIAMQVCTAGNLRTTLLCAEMARKHGAFERFLIATDTPTGSGVMPLGLIYTISQIASLTSFDVPELIAAATGNVAKCYGLNSGFLKPSYDADIVLIDAPLGGTQVDALAALKNGDPCAIGAVLTAGVPRFVGRSNNTPPPIREIKVLRSNVMNMFQG